MKTNPPIVLTIFGNERCVVSLEDLEAAAHAIHTKAVREREQADLPPTHAPENEGPNSVINAQPDAARSGSPPALRDDTRKEANDHA